MVGGTRSILHFFSGWVGPKTGREKQKLNKFGSLEPAKITTENVCATRNSRRLRGRDPKKRPRAMTSASTCDMWGGPSLVEKPQRRSRQRPGRKCLGGPGTSTRQIVTREAEGFASGRPEAPSYLAYRCAVHTRCAQQAYTCQKHRAGHLTASSEISSIRVLE